MDLVQIRAMLALTPEERLQRVEDFLASVYEIRELNDARTLRRALRSQRWAWAALPVLRATLQELNRRS